VQPLVPSTDQAHAVEVAPGAAELRIYSHSSLFYWWPVWFTGFIMAGITYMGGSHVDIGGIQVMIHPSKNLGVIFGAVLFLVILFTNTTVRGLASVIVVLAVMFLTVLFAWLGWWESILSVVPHLAGFLNLGFYTVFSAALFVVWAGTVFIYDRMSYWSLRPGQITHTFVIGGAERSFDTRGMLFEKASQDLFRHFLLGLGAGDMRIVTTGARSEEILIPNVLFVDSHLRAMQQLVAVKPGEPAPNVAPR
jgi:hypothetical protein